MNNPNSQPLITEVFNPSNQLCVLPLDWLQQVPVLAVLGTPKLARIPACARSKDSCPVSVLWPILRKSQADEELQLVISSSGTGNIQTECSIQPFIASSTFSSVVGNPYLPGTKDQGHKWTSHAGALKPRGCTCPILSHLFLDRHRVPLHKAVLQHTHPADRTRCKYSLQKLTKPKTSSLSCEIDRVLAMLLLDMLRLLLSDMIKGSGICDTMTQLHDCHQICLRTDTKAQYCHCDPRRWISLWHIFPCLLSTDLCVCGQKELYWPWFDGKSDFQARGRLYSPCEHGDIYKLACLFHSTHLFFHYCLVIYAPAFTSGSTSVMQLHDKARNYFNCHYVGERAVV